jgi:hypothetical protein
MPPVASPAAATLAPARPARPKADHRRLRRRPERHRHLLADRRAVRLRDVLGNAVLLPAHAGDPGDHRAHRRVTGQGITSNIHAHYFRSRLHLIVALLLIANTINLGADLGAMAAALKLADRRPDRPLVMSIFRAYFLVDFQPT